VVHNLRGALSGKPQKIDQLWHITTLGYPTGLQVEDVDCLLTDGLAMGDDDCRLAVDAALIIYRLAGELPGVLARISSAVGSDEVASEVYRELTKPREPLLAHLEMERKITEIQAENAVERVQARSIVD